MQVPARVFMGSLSESGAELWLRRFHQGEREALGECYRDHFRTVCDAVRPMLGVADGETVVHEVFLKILSQPEVRASFSGGSMGAWLRTIARRAAIDFARRHRREVPLDVGAEGGSEPSRTDSFASASEARMLLDRFRREVLPPKWSGVFEARFLHRLDQREAARRLAMSRTTLAYQEQRIGRLLRKFVLRMERT